MKINVPFVGHKNILSLHEKTIEITKESELTTNGDCIIGVGANISCIDLPEKMKKKIQNPKTKISFSIEVDSKKFTINGYGSKKLSLKHTMTIGQPMIYALMFITYLGSSEPTESCSEPTGQCAH